ncbi:MAG: hypothetical protein BWY64_02293 [bacterium ADurb.Bin363]|nr:MAG: hypothetical protein BWY64_02293 [bacterium ADurb.Bin363]
MTLKLRFDPRYILIVAVCFNLYCLFPEISLITPDMNDNVFHYGLILRLGDALKAGETFWDCWVPYWTMGFPVFHYYQFLPHLIVIIIYTLLGKTVQLFTLFKIIQYLLLSTFPIRPYFLSYFCPRLRVGMGKLYLGGFWNVQSALRYVSYAFIRRRGL